MEKHLLRDARESIAALGDQNRRFDGKKILLTGAAGFLGAQFIHYFLALNDSGMLGRPCRVIAWDTFLRGIPPWLEGLRGRTDLKMEKRDITQKKRIPKADFIIHAASIASPIFYRKFPIETMDANVIGLRFLLDHAEKTRPESFLFFSSSEIYGDPDPEHIPTREDYRGYVSCTGPRACYDESKRYGETLCMNFFRARGVPVKIARPFNNYGPGLKISDRRVLPDLFRDILRTVNPRLLSDGRATRTFCYISDAITGYLLILLSPHGGEAFNIGNDRPEISMLDLARLAVEVSGKALEVVYEKSPDPQYLTDNPVRRCPCIEKARKLLQFNPRIDLKEGLARTYGYYLDHPEEEEA